LHVLIGGFQQWGWLMLLASLGVLISAAYAMRTMGQLFTGPVRPTMSELHDLQPHEWLAAVPLAAGLVILGLYPAPVIALISATVKGLAAIFTYSL
jgi:NADH-quinone oxidoreductase subunit M